MSMAEMLLCCVFEAGSISLHDMEIDRRPYHRYCGCALHKFKGTNNNNNNETIIRRVSLPTANKPKTTGSQYCLTMAPSKDYFHSSDLLRHQYQIKPHHHHHP
ncbi:hypothetical protein CsatB_013987 [Cannabis sativa]